MNDLTKPCRRVDGCRFVQGHSGECRVVACDAIPIYPWEELREADVYDVREVIPLLRDVARALSGSPGPGYWRTIAKRFRELPPHWRKLGEEGGKMIGYLMVEGKLVPIQGPVTYLQHLEEIAHTARTAASKLATMYHRGECMPRAEVDLLIDTFNAWVRR